MSLVGTRPPTVDEWDKYELHHRARLATKLGLTPEFMQTLENGVYWKNLFENLK